jgi:uncharacterized RDD family membrane protein YckC
MKTAVPQVINGFEEASSGSRLVARIIDSVIAWLIFLPMGFLSILVLQLIFPVLGNDSSLEWIGFVFSILLILLYDTLLHAFFGKTLGKKILKLRVMNIRGENLSIPLSFARAILLFISVLVVIFLTFATASIFGWFVLIGLRRYQRYPHDKFINSYVVHEVKLTQEQSQTRFQATPLADLERLHLAGMITDEEYQKKVKDLS